MKPSILSSARLSLPLASALAALLAAPQLHAIDYTWTLGNTGNQTWTTVGNWLSPNGVFASGSGNALIFSPTTWGNGTTTINTSVPTALSMNTLTLGGTANASGNSTVSIASSSSTWTIGGGGTSVVNLDGTFNSTRSLTYNVNAKIELNQTTTTFTGNGTGNFNFAQVISEASAGYGILKSGSSTLSLTNAANTYTGVTNITNGILDATTFANVNTVSSIGKGSAIGSAADLVINGGTLRHSAANVASTDRLFSIGTSNGTIDSSAALSTNTLSFTGTGAMGFNSQLGTRTLTLGGSNIGNNTMAVAMGDDGSSNATSLSKTGAGLWILSGTNTYTGTTTATGGALVATNTGALSGYNASGKVVFNGGAIGGQVGGGGWTTGQIDTLLSNATKTSGQLAIDTTNGDVIQWANLTTANLGGLGIAKAGSNNLTLNQSGSYGGLAVYGTGNLVLDNATITTPTLTFATGASNTAVLGGTLSMSGGSITRTNRTASTIDTITSTITGSPTVTYNSSSSNSDRVAGMYFAPEANATQTLGTITVVNSGFDKAGFAIGGVSTGNSLTSFTNTSADWGTFRKRGPGTWTVGSIDFGAFQNYAGTTIAQGLIDGSENGAQVFGGTLVLDYTNANTNRLTDGEVLYLLGGTLQLDRSSGASGTHTEIVNSTTLGLNGGQVNLTRGSGSSATLRMNAITRNTASTATINFGAANLASTDTTNTNGILGAWATVGGVDWAYNSGSTTVGGADASQPTGAADGYIRAYSGYTNVDRLTPGTIADGSTTNVRLVEGSGSAGNVAMGATTTTINTLNQSASGGTGAATIDTASKTLGVNGILAGAGSGGLTIGVNPSDGTLRAGTSGGELLIHNYSSNPLTINSVIANNTNPSRLTVTGTGTTILAGTNTYSGNTKITGGVLQAAIGTGLSTSTYLQLDGGVFQSSGSFTRANDTTASGTRFQWSGEGGGGFAAKGGKLTVTVNNSVGTEQTWAWVTSTTDTTLATGNNTILGPLKFGSTTADSEVEFRNNINLNGEVREIHVTDNTGSSADFATLSGVIRNSTTATAAPAGIYKSGNGTLVLSNANTYNGTTTVAGGTLKVNGSILSPSVVINAGASLGGSGVASLATLSGAGSIDPGNSPGILTAAATDPSGGLDYNFEMTTAANTLPTWSNATASGNDVLRLTDATIPFPASLNSSNTISLYFGTGINPTAGDVFTGGFYTDKNSDFLAAISSATFQYFLQDDSGLTTYNGAKYAAYTGPLSFDVSTVAQTANFGSGDVSGYVTQFTVVPEPKAALLGSIGLLLLLRRRR